jgi:hypothetical protein
VANVIKTSATAIQVAIKPFVGIQQSFHIMKTILPAAFALLQMTLESDHPRLIRAAAAAAKTADVVAAVASCSLRRRRQLLIY